MQTFNEVVKGIKKSEKYVDKVLDAARLRRIESGRMSDKRFEEIISLIKDILFGLAFLAFAFMTFAFMSGMFF